MTTEKLMIREYNQLLLELNKVKDEPVTNVLTLKELQIKVSELEIQIASRHFFLTYTDVNILDKVSYMNNDGITQSALLCMMDNYNKILKTLLKNIKLYKPLNKQYKDFNLQYMLPYLEMGYLLKGYKPYA